MSDERLQPVDESIPPAEMSTVTAASSPRSPRMAIVHVLVYTACVAVAMSFKRDVLRGEINGSAENSNSLIDGGLLFLWTMLEAIAMSAVLVMFARWWKRIVFPVAPGEWMLVAAGCGIWLALPLSFVLQQIPQDDFDFKATFRAILAVNGIISLAMGVPLAVATWRLHRDLLWRCCLGGSALSIGSQATVAFVSAAKLSSGDSHGFDLNSIFSMFAGVAAGIGALMAVIFFCIAVVVDLRRKTRRGWVHWLGICVVSASVVSMILNAVLRAN